MDKCYKYICCIYCSLYKVVGPSVSSYIRTNILFPLSCVHRSVKLVLPPTLNSETVGPRVNISGDSPLKGSMPYGQILLLHSRLSVYMSS